MIFKVVFLISAYFGGLYSKNPIAIVFSIAYLGIGGFSFAAMGFGGSSGILVGLMGIAMVIGAGHVFLTHRD